MEENETWPTTGVGGVDVLRVVLRRGPSVYGTYVVVRNTRTLDAASVAALEAKGFRPFAGQSHARGGRTLDASEILDVFPGARQTTRRSADVRRDVEWRDGIFPSGMPETPAPAVRGAPSPAQVPPPSGASARPRPFGAGFSLFGPVVAPPPPAAAAAPARLPTVPAPPAPPVEVRTPEPEGPPVPADDPEVPPLRGQVNAYQCRYRPASRLGVPIANVPVNLAEPTERALARIAAAHGDVDRFVAVRLRWTPSELERYLSPEQIDAVAMALFCMDAGQGFLLGDQTGLGKGRVVAAIARAILLSGRTPIVVTEKANLFADLYRDVADIGSLELFGAPFVLNDGVEILDTVTGEVLFPAIDRQVVAKAVRSGRMPKGFKVFLSTYSQFNQKGSPKAAMLASVAAKGDLVADECHNAVGDSNTSVNLSVAMEAAGGVVYSSATFARDAQNLSAYRRLFPASMQSSDLLDILKAGGRSVAEAMSQMLAEAGSYLRREKDLSEITLRVVEDTARLERNKRLADRLSPVLADIAALSRSVSDVAAARNEEAGQEAFSFGPGKDRTGPNKSKEYWYAGNFGSRLSVIVRQAVTAMLTDFCIERCLAHIAEGRKPVVVIESTMESLMREMMGEDGDAAPDESDDSLAGERPADFRDALNLMVDRTMQVSVRRPKSKEAEKVDVTDPFLVAKADDIRRRVAEFPDLPLSPIDAIAARLAEAGRTCGEISARGVRVEDGRYVKAQAPDRIPQIAAFNSGALDALVLTGAGSTGLSLHASEKFKDRRKRVMIELQVFSNVVGRMQFLGRVDRRGQVSVPLFETLSTGLPLQTRNLAMQNRKMADLSANVTGSSSNATSIDVPDLFDAVGNGVARDLLEERPSLAERMFIATNLDDPDAAAADLYHVDKVMQRLSLLPSYEQDEIFAHLVSAYEAKVADMAARGQSLRGARDIGDGWTVVERRLFEAPVERDGPVFGQPLYVTTIERDAQRRPLDGAAVVKAVADARKRRPVPDAGSCFSSELNVLTSNRQRILHMSLPKGFLNVDQALRDPRPNPVRTAERRLEQMRRILQTVRPGCAISMAGADGPEVGIVTDVVPPSDRDVLHQPGRWTIRYVVPGDERARSVSLAGYMGDATSALDPPPRDAPASPRILERFDKAPRGTVRERRKVLDGNPLRAVITARHHKWSSLVTWTDADGQQNRSVLVPKNEQNTVSLLPGRVRDAGLARVLLDEGAEIWTNQDDQDAGGRLRIEGRRIVFDIPGTPKGMKIFSEPRIAAVTGPFVGDGTRRQAAIPADRVEDLCDALAACGHAFHYSGRYRESVLARMTGGSSAAAPRPG